MLGMFEEQQGLGLAGTREQGEVERLGRAGGMNGGEEVAGPRRALWQGEEGVSCEPDGSHWLTLSW